jgi:hypothetical protein
MATPFRLKRSAISGKRPEIGDLQLGELALNFYDGYLFARRDTGGVGIADTVSLLNPWTENFGAGSIFYEQSVGIGTTSPTEKLTVFGSSYVSENFNTKTLFSSTITSNNGIFTSFSILGISTFSGNVDINAALDVDGHTELDELNVAGVSTFASDLDINAAIDVDGHTELDELNVSGIATFVSTIDANGGLDVFGQTEIDDLNVTGIATIHSLNVSTNFDVYDGTATFHNNVFISGNLSIGGTTTTLLAQDLFVIDKNIVLGITTTLLNVDISTDDTANGGGVSVASTEGSPLVSLQAVGVNSLPDTYKKILWSKANTYGIGTTDAWMFNYAVGIGSTLVPNNVRLAVGEIKLTDDTINTPQLLSGISTFTGTTEVRNSSFKVTNTGASGQYLEIIQNGDSSLNLNKVGTGSFFIEGNNIYLGDDDSAETYAGFEKDGKVFLNFDNSTKLETTGYGVTITGGVYVSGISTFVSDLDINAAIDVDGHTELDELQVTGISTFTADIDINAAIDVDGHTELDELQVTGVSTFASLVDFNGGVDISGHLEIDNVSISGISTFTDTTDNTLGDPDTGSIQIDGGLGVNKNVTVGGNLDVQGYSNFVGVVTFRGGTINLGDANTDDVNVGGEFISSLIPNDDDSYDLGSDSKQWRNIYINGQAEIDDLNVSGITTTVLFNVGVGGTVITTTETGLVGINSTAPTTTLDVDGTINSSTDVTINGTSVLTTATNDAVALAIALG